MSTSLSDFTPEQLVMAEALAEQMISGQRALRILPFYLDESPFPSLHHYCDTLRLTGGTLLISSRGFFDTLLLGVVAVQSVGYIRFVRTDRRYIIAIVILNVLATLAASIVIDAICIFVVQVFYVDRAYRLHRHWWPLAVLGPIILASLAAGVAMLKIEASNLTYIDPEFLKLPHVRAVTFTYNGLVLLVDAAITVVMVYGLHRNKTGWRHTDSVLKGLIIKCFEAQIPALILAICTITLWEAKLEIAICFVMVHTKIYVTGLLATLNFRVSPAGSNDSGQSYQSQDISGNNLSLTEIPNKKLGVVVRRQTESATHQIPPYDSKRSKVMDVEQASSHSDQFTTGSQGEFHHPFAQHDPAGWESTAALHYLPSTELKRKL